MTIKLQFFHTDTFQLEEKQLGCFFSEHIRA